MIQVLKFGGTSIANAKCIFKLREIVQGIEYSKKIVVISAIAGITDMLLAASNLASNKDIRYRELNNEIEAKHLKIIRDLLPVQSQSYVLSKVKFEMNSLELLLKGAFLIGELPPKLLNKILNYGALFSSHIIYEFFISEGLDICFKDSQDLIKTDTSFGKPCFNIESTYKNCRSYFTNISQSISLVTGFTAISKDIGGSALRKDGADYTAAIIAAAVDADILEIWSDVNGVHTADPKSIKQSKVIPYLTYDEAFDFSLVGAKVLCPDVISLLKESGNSIRIKNILNPSHHGTLISKDFEGFRECLFGVGHIEDLSILSVQKVKGMKTSDIFMRISNLLSQLEIEILSIMQDFREHSLSLVISKGTCANVEVIDQINKVFSYEKEMGKIGPLKIENNLAIVALIGSNRGNESDLCVKMVRRLRRRGINIKTILNRFSDNHIAILINEDDLYKSMNVLHGEFVEKKVNFLSYKKLKDGVGRFFVNKTIFSSSKYNPQN